MLGKKVKSRVFYLILLLATATAVIFITLKSLEDNVVYFISPTEIKELGEIDYNKKYRVGGMVKKNSVNMSADYVKFVITDFKSEISVKYSGVIPNLFIEEKGVVAEGFLKDRNFLEASKILAKHDENYMPPEVKEALGEK